MAAPAAISRQATSNPSPRVFESRKYSESGKYSGRIAAQTSNTHEIATTAVSARRACADIRAAAANNPIASTKSACANAAIDFGAACNSPQPVAHRNAPEATQAAAQASRHRSQKTRKKSRLTATKIRAAVSRAVSLGAFNQGTVN